MKKILIFSMAYFPHVGGAEVAVKELTDRIHDIEFHMVTMRFSAAEPREEKMGNVIVHRVGIPGSTLIHKFFFQIFSVRHAMSLHKRVGFDAVWALMAHSAGVPAALFKLRYSTVPMLLTLQEGDPPRQIERTMLPLWPLFSRAFTHADRVQTISNFLGEWARVRGFSGPLVVIPNGVDLKHFTGEPISHEGTVLITASRLFYKNAVDNVIEALPLLPEVHFQIAGIGPEESKLRQKAKELKVEERIHFLGHIDHAQLPILLRSADIFIRPSRSEGMGNAFIEAMASSIPVIGTAVGGIPDFLKDGETGFVVEVDNPKSIADAVEKILKNPQQTQTIVKKAKELSTQYDWDMLAIRMRQEAFEPLWQKQ
jgi:glycosyltransferase involved in cell wall biosynthesis